MASEYLGEFEELVLLAVCGLSDQAYALAVQLRLAEVADRRATLGAIYRSLSRLEGKGFVRSRLGDITRERGGKRKRLYDLTGTGTAALTRAKAARDGLRQGLEFRPALQ